ncbi:hypothetical protein CPLU01_15187 [Colletotrichum plurivorum]|uniref:Uncharacterized protein n=1 Tax=Colletotrichum plurivorum TaxID=2175906 RepID=A0A8H6JDC0_9PEZI|nr:hypothetical protein CPLU01_15187 [Colletotrichum plurivorum]
MDSQHASHTASTNFQSQHDPTQPSPTSPELQSASLKPEHTYTETETHIERSSTGNRWLYKPLRLKYLLTFVAIDIILLVVVISLTVLSGKNQGLISIPSQNISTTTTLAANDRSIDFSFSFETGVLWTSLPSFVFSLFAAYWGWIAAAVSDRQPFIDLRKPGGADARQTVLLDYRFVPIFWRWVAAFKRSHAAVGSTVLLTLALTYLMQPLSARLFAPQSVLLPGEVPVSFTAEYEEEWIGANMDWRPIMSAVSATKLYNGGRIGWTDDQYAYRPFRARAGAVDANARVAANTTAYAAYLNCEVIPDYKMGLNRRDSLSGTVTVAGTDRGCDFEQDFAVISSQEIYFKTTTQLQCSADAYYSRLVFAAGTFSSSAQYLLANVSVISCATGYRVQPGVVTASGAPASDGTGTTTMHSFQPTGEPDTERPVLWRIFEDGIFSTTAWSQGAEWTTTDFGSLILYHAQKRSPAGFLDPEVLKSSVSDMFTSVYMTAVALNGMRPTPGAASFAGSIVTPTTRLFVVPWVAYVVAVFLVVALGFAVFVLVHAQTSQCILAEEPRGLLSLAGLLEDSSLAGAARRARMQSGFKGQTRKTGKKMPEVKDRKWMALRDENDTRWIISSVERKTDTRAS